MQTVTDKQKHRPEDALTCLMYDPQQKQLLSGSVLPKVSPYLCLQVQLTSYTPCQSAQTDCSLCHVKPASHSSLCYNLVKLGSLQHVYIFEFCTAVGALLNGALLAK